MAGTRSRKIFVNLAVRDLTETRDFFSALGFEFQPQVHRRDGGVHDRERRGLRDAPRGALLQDVHEAPAVQHSHAYRRALRLSCGSRAEVDELVKKAVAAGGSRAMDPQDHGLMYASSFYDIDGHHWEVLWMDPAAVQ